MGRWAAVAGGVALACAATGAWGAAAPATVETSGLAITLTTAPSPPARQEATTFEITVRDAAGNAVTGARISLEFSMHHGMPENRPRVLERGGGRYVAAAALSMGGEWLAAVEVVHTDGRRARAEFPLRVR
ncbi:MAG TPA: FixH family protein [Candidatus Methylomirabilis sp.]